MINLRKLLNEQKTKPTYDMLMDVISEFLELKEDFILRFTEIEKKLNHLKPKLDDRGDLTQMDFKKNGGVSSNSNGKKYEVDTEFDHLDGKRKK